MTIPEHSSCTLETTVTRQATAVSVGSGDVEVFATPMMIALMEGAAAKCLKPFLEEGQTSVGAAISVTHLSATPVGMRVKATASVVACEGKSVQFSLSAEDENGLIGEGTHTRFLVNQARFQQKAQAKLG